MNTHPQAETGRERRWLALARWTVCVAAWVAAGAARAEDRVLDTFQRTQLTGVYFSEGAGAGDINRDGHMDVVYGPYWFAGPEFQEKHEIYPAKPQPTERYADNFFAWVYDFNGDGWNDVLVVGFPGTPAHVYENPKQDGLDRPWPKHVVLDQVSNESPQFTNLIGDERPELVCTHDGFYGYASINWEKPFDSWTFHAVSDKSAAVPFGHGLGIGDLSGDGKLDIIYSGGWLEQPADDPTAGRWPQHDVAFSNAYGGAEMYAYDVDGDGDQDVITSLAAHDFGLAWYEQSQQGGQRVFQQHLIMGALPEHNTYGLAFSEPHSVILADIDGDGLKDIVTGKCYWSHHRQSPMWDAGAVVYWFRLVRTKEGVDWLPYQADGEAGTGRQIGIHDVNGDQLPDIVVGGMKGAHVLVHRREKVDEAKWKTVQPKPFARPQPRADRGDAAPIDQKTGRVPNAVEGEALKVLSAGAGRTQTQGMTAFNGSRWSGGEQLFWTGAKPGSRLELEFDVAAAGEYSVVANFTTARDYATIVMRVDDDRAGVSIDLYDYPDVRTTGELKLSPRQLSSGKHRLILEITGANTAAVKAYLVGLDYVRLEKKDGK